MKFKSDSVTVPPHKKVKLSKWPTLTKPLYKSKDHCRELLTNTVAQISELQERHYSSKANALLLIFQGMDGAGKDSTIKHVMSGINPQGCHVVGFRPPSEEEASHDFLWRTSVHLPRRGHIGIFNRSYYEEVLIVRVHPEILKSEAVASRKLPKKHIWENRFESINDHEKHLYREETRILKFFLHISKDEQKRRFLARIDEPKKNWKIVPSDIEERKSWDKYQKAYEACLSATSTKHSPWHIIPADDKENARLMISQILLQTFISLNLDHPTTSLERRKELQQIRARLVES